MAGIQTDFEYLLRVRNALDSTQEAIERGQLAYSSSRWLLMRLGEPFEWRCLFCRKSTRQQIRGGQLICLECFPK